VGSPIKEADGFVKIFIKQGPGKEQSAVGIEVNNLSDFLAVSVVDFASRELRRRESNMHSETFDTRDDNPEDTLDAFLKKHSPKGPTKD
tara:strand:+ start:3842 stop:4108 length:267 start_codon:yes stop_codon:yes gene_type:complete